MMKLLFTIAFILLSLASSLYAHKGDLGHYVARAYPLGEMPPPNVDGILTDEAWQEATCAAAQKAAAHAPRVALRAVRHGVRG